MMATNEIKAAKHDVSDVLMNGSDENSSQYLTFILGGEEYGVDILRVQEIKGWEITTPIPNTMEFIKGVINLRGAVVPIIDLRQRFELENFVYNESTVVIVVKVKKTVVDEGDERIVGIVVDAVSDVYTLAGNEMKPPPDFGSIISIDFVRGLATVDEKMVIILDIDQLINIGVMGTDSEANTENSDEEESE
jgi:purine-binding chemotaxis protein CheW